MFPDCQSHSTYIEVGDASAIKEAKSKPRKQQIIKTKFRLTEAET